MDAGVQVLGWGEFGGFNIISGQTIRMGLSWPGDAGPVYLTAASLTQPSTLVRESSSRDVGPGVAPYRYQTTEWITVTATSSYGLVNDIVLSYFGTHAADDIIAEAHEVVSVLRYHVIAVAGRVVGWRKVTPPVPGRPVPLIGPARDGHTLHSDIEIDGEPDDPNDLAQLLTGQL
jgi:hypothetical protein